MTPSLGRIVILRGPAAESNGATECPAVITRVWNDGMVNVAAFPDAAAPRPATSVRLVADSQTADEVPPTHHVAFWPPRV